MISMSSLNREHVMSDPSVQPADWPAILDKPATADRPALPPLRGLVAREPTPDRRSPGFDYPRLTGRL
jgi:hypothetical protein